MWWSNMEERCGGGNMEEGISGGLTWRRESVVV